MNMRLLFAPLMLINAAGVAAELPMIPDKSIAVKKELLFSDDFEGAERRQGLAPGRPDLRRRKRGAQGNADARQERSCRRRQAGHPGPRRRAWAGNPHQGQRRRGPDSL